MFFQKLSNQRKPIYLSITFEISNSLKCLVAFLLLIVVSACNDDNGSTSPEPYTYTVPVQTGDGWQVGHIQDVGIDGALLTEIMDLIRHEEDGFRLIDSILIVKDGLLVFDELTRTRPNQFDGRRNNNNLALHSVHSVTKSVNSILLGIAIDQGHIPSTNILVHDYFADKMPIQNFTATKQASTLDDWLTMQHGHDWNERDPGYTSSNNISIQMIESADPLQFLLDQPMATPPGTTFAYSTGVSYALGSLLERATGESVVAYLQQNLLQPLQIQEFDYFVTGGQLDTGWGLFLTSRDMAKIGQLLLDGGRWDGVQIVSESWVITSTQAHVDFGTGRDGYGYQWWTHDFDHNGNTVYSFRADGYGGQFIIVIPDLNLVVAMTGRAYSDAEGNERGQIRIMQDYILPSIM